MVFFTIFNGIDVYGKSQCRLSKSTEMWNFLFQIWYYVKFGLESKPSSEIMDLQSPCIFLDSERFNNSLCRFPVFNSFQLRYSYYGVS